MERMKAGDPGTQTPNLAAENLAKLKELFPELVTEDEQGVAVNVDVLKQLVGDRTVTDAQEKFGLTWHGKRLARQLALAPSATTLRPCPEDSVNWDTTQNLMIEGDNLEVLKLLQKSYAGRVKLIYIDPPYNTGKDFVYLDDFSNSIGNYQKLIGLRADSGERLSSQAKIKNTENSGRYHTDWLSMMYPRLKLARNLLSENGAIFISIDDNEAHNLRMVCDEVFGEENFVACVVWQKKYAVSNDDPGIGAMHDYVVVYQKSDMFRRGLLPRTEKQLSRYVNLDDDPRGVWSSDNYVSNKSRFERPTLWYAITHPKTGEDVWPEEHAVWRYSRDMHEKMEAENRLYWGPDQSYKKPRLKRFLSEIQEGLVPSTWWPFSEVGHNDEAQKETGDLLGRKVFDTPKPIRFLKRLITIGADNESVILDFFAGSGSIGQAVFDFNANHSTNHRFILVQLPESTDRSDYPDICEITKERLRRAGEKVKLENPMFTGDIGFRVFKLDSSNIREWEPNPNDLGRSLEEYAEHLKADRSEDDILYELLLKLGLDLCVPIEERVIAGKQVYSVGAGVLIACLAISISRGEVEALGQGITAWYTELAPTGEITCVFRDSAFADDVAKTNLTAILQQHGIVTVRSL